MPIKQVLNKGKVPVKIWTDVVESQAYDQLTNVSMLPFVFKHVAVMPDCHVGKGAVVGSVIATRDAICPATVGVDIGCGMIAARLVNLHADHFTTVNLREIRSEIEKAVPVGFNGNASPSSDAVSWFGWSRFENLHPKAQSIQQRAVSQLGSLGGGNHFIEICLDTENRVWIMLHSGSRNIGKSLAEFHIDTAKGMMKQMFIHLPDADLAYLVAETPEFDSYMHDLSWAQSYAEMNREIMLDQVLWSIKKVFAARYNMEKIGLEDRVNCHHNFAVREHHFGSNVIVTRKGAVRARQGDMGIIPGSMGTKSYIVRGLGNPESFNSCSHGAGRRMSRSEAKKRFTVEDLEQQTHGVECRKDAGVLDEIPGSYKDIDEVIANQSDLVEVIATLKQIMCVKG